MWMVTFDVHAALVGFSTRAVLNNWFAFCSERLFILANVCWAQIEAPSLGREETNRVEELPVQHFHTDNSAVPGRQELLYERGLVDAQLNGPSLNSTCQVFPPSKILDLGPAATNIRLDD